MILAIVGRTPPAGPQAPVEPLTASGGRPAAGRVAPWFAGLSAAAAHLGALRNGYAFDDAAIVSHPLIQSAGSLPAALASPWWYDTGRLYRPAALLSLGVDRVAGGGAPMSHAVNVALHAIVAAFVARLCLRWLPPVAALAAAMLFALLPVHAEAVSTVVGRAELLSALGLVGLMLLVTRASAPTVRSTLGAALLSGLALAAKEGGAAAPLLALAAAHAAPRQRAHARRWAASALVGTLVLILARVLVLGTVGGDAPHPYFRGMAIDTRLGVAISLLPRTAAMLSLPVAPSVEEVPPLAYAENPSALLLGAGALLLTGTLALVVRHRRSPSAMTLGALVLAATIAPTSNLVFAEGALTSRTLYAPSIGAAMIVGAALAALAATRARIAILPVMAATGLVGAVMSARETRVWRDTPTVVATMAARHPESYRGHALLGYAARDAQRLDESLRHFRTAIALFPREPEMLTDAATVALRVRDTTTAVRWLELALEAGPRSARARTRVVSILLARGDSSRARELLHEGLRHEPEQHTWVAMLTPIEHSQERVSVGHVGAARSSRGGREARGSGS
jgi:Flp pilus assembly protein TadD